ncbi:hypothetical protein ACFONC_03215 [Luteimonas soli]|uniref:Zeta toxin domain-containing protein n=1 Tax=Luteimonas soli TaxID=1648966 RepID=A0ABV7XG99_9GAMM
MSSPTPDQSPAISLTLQLERLTDVAGAAANGTRPGLTVDERAKMVAVAESAAATRTLYALGDDPVVDAVNSTPERHHLAASSLARALASHDGAEHPNPFQNQRLATAYAQQQEYDQYLAKREAEQNNVAGGRWIVQQWNEARGVYQDQLQTNSATEAEQLFRKGSDYRIHDARFNDVAAEYPQASRSEPRGVPEYSERSGFLRALANEQDRPAPLRVDRIDYAHGDRQAVQQLAMGAVLNDTARMMDRYRELPDAHGGRYVGADLAKELFADYNQSREARNRYNAPVHNSAAALAGQLFEQAVLDHTHPERDRAVFLTGSPGAGKTTMVLNQGELQANIAVVYEGQMIRPEQSYPKIDAALAQGLKPEIIAVQPRPETALENTFNRFDHVGRGASINIMSQIQGELAEGLRQIHAKYGDRVDLRVVDARQVAQDGQATEYKGWQHLQLLQSEGSRDAIKDRLAAELERHRAAGTITDACYRQAAGQAPAREQLTDRRMGPGHDPDAERIEHKPHAPLSAEQARVLIATTAERPHLRSDELARAHFVARQDKAWTEDYDKTHGADIARRSQRLAIQHGQVLAQKLLQEDPVKACTVYPELVNSHRAIAAAGAHLREQGQPPKAIEATQQRLKLAIADGLSLGVGSPRVAVKQLEQQAKQQAPDSDRSR